MSRRNAFIPGGYEGTVRNEPAAFGTDLYQVLAEEARDLVFSPSSVAGALRMAWYGARGQTAAELARALRLGQDADPGEAPAPPHAQAPAVFLAPNTAWIQSGFAVRPEFAAQLSRLAGAMLASADFAAAPDRARAEINQAIAGQTAGKITDLLAVAAAVGWSGPAFIYSIRDINTADPDDGEDNFGALMTTDWQPKYAASVLAR